MGDETLREMEAEEARMRMEKIERILLPKDDLGRFDKAHALAKLPAEHEAIENEQDRVLRFADYLAIGAFGNALKDAKTDEERQQIRDAEGSVEAAIRATERLKSQATLVTCIPFMRTFSRYSPILSSMQCAHAK